MGFQNFVVVVELENGVFDGNVLSRRMVCVRW